MSLTLKDHGRNGAKLQEAEQHLWHRNAEIRNQFSNGVTIDQLSDQFCLSNDSIKENRVFKKIEVVSSINNEVHLLLSRARACKNQLILKQDKIKETRA